MHYFLVVVSGLMSIACVAPHGIPLHSQSTRVTCARQDANPIAEQPAERYRDWVDWSDRFVERGRTEKERALRRYIVKLKGIENLGAIRYLPEREERLFAERESAIPILLEMLDSLPWEARVGDGGRLYHPIEDLERLARRDPSAFRAEHMELIHKIISENKHYLDPLLSVVAILRRKESIPHLVPLLDQPKRSHVDIFYALEEIAHPDAIPHLRAYAERNPAQAHWATPVIERIQIDNLPLSERVQKWEAIASELASEEAFQPEKVRATRDQAWWVLSRLSEHGEWRHAEIILKLKAAARQAGDGGVEKRAERAYQALAEKLPVAQQKLELWEKILKEVSAEKLSKDGTERDRAVWAVERLEKEGGAQYLGLFEEMRRRKELFEGGYNDLLRQAVEQAIARLKQNGR